MHKIVLLIHTIILLTLLSSRVYSSSSSSYLIAQSAITLNDYKTASTYYENGDLSDLHLYDLQKKLIAFVNSNNLTSASIVAKEIINLDYSNQEAWLIYLANAKLTNELYLFREFDNQKEGKEYNIVNYIFYSNGQLKQNNNDIARALFAIIEVSGKDDKNFIESYDYLLFYLTLALYFDPTFNEALFFQAHFYEQIKNYEMAEKIYQKINKNHPYYLEGQQKIVFNKVKDGNIKEAEKILITLIKNNKDNNVLNISLADFYRIIKQYDQAILHYTNIIKLNDKN